SELDVFQPQLGNDLLAALDLFGREVDAHEGTARQAQGHRDEVACYTAAQFQDAAMLNRRGLQAVEQGDHRQGLGMSVKKSVGEIRDFVVAGRRCWHAQTTSSDSLLFWPCARVGPHLHRCIFLHIPASLYRRAERAIGLLLLELDLDL